MAPLPDMVCATGMPWASASAVTAPCAPDRCTPPPASIRGRSAARIVSAARDSASRSGRQRRAGAASCAGSASKSAGPKPWVAWATSSGTSTTTGPGRPEVATAKARATIPGMRSTASTRRNALQAGRRIAAWSVSWVMLSPAWRRCASPTIATTGEPALSASTSPVTRLVAPGPSVASTSPTRPETLA